MPKIQNDARDISLSRSIFPKSKRGNILFIQTGKREKSGAIRPSSLKAVLKKPYLAISKVIIEQF
ncbi:MAG TPA: hypothetical protein PK263_01465 [bacterium]|nr:hypothetical protein [bacterium]